MNKPESISTVMCVLAALVIPGSINGDAIKADTRVAQPRSSDSSVRIPLLGFAAREGLDIRPILGSVEASGLAPSLSLPSGVSAVMLAPGQRYMLAVLDQVMISGLTPDGAGPFNPISGAMASVDRVDFSPSGSAAILYSSSAQHLQILAGLPDSPNVVLDVDTRPWAKTLTAAAVSDDAAVVLVSLSDGDSAVIAVLGGAGQPNTAANVSAVPAMRFIGKTHDAVAVDSQANQVFLLRAEQDELYSTRLLAGESQGVTAPADVELSTDGSRVYVSNSGTNVISILDIATGNQLSLNCDFALAGFQRLIGSVVRVTGRNTNSVWVMDTDSASPRISFVPRLP